jgi:ketol-acid reductoisomerase
MYQGGIADMSYAILSNAKYDDDVAGPEIINAGLGCRVR